MSDLQQLRALSVAERLQLVEDLWDTIASEPDDLGLSPAHLSELDRRIDRFEQSPAEGVEWNTLKARILNSL